MNELGARAGAPLRRRADRTTPIKFNHSTGMYHMEIIIEIHNGFPLASSDVIYDVIK